MRKRKSFWPYVQFLFVLFCIFSTPKGSLEVMRGGVVAIFAPTWQGINSLKKKLSPKSEEMVVAEEINRLDLENQLLINEVKKLREILDQEEIIFLQKSFLTDSEKEASSNYFNLIHRQDFINLLNIKLFSIPAVVIYRSGASWSSSVWVNVGKKHNEVLGKDIISINSPAVIGHSVVGVIDYVGSKQSRVRLITDSGLNPSVRAIREVEGETKYLAKGWLSGSTNLKWRTRSNTIKGVGFNYDFSDDEGLARDLRTGEVLGSYSDGEKIPLIQSGDLLITSGMDGVFPPGLKVATVTDVNLLQEGNFFYEIEAVPTAGSLDDLNLIYILPPVGFDSLDSRTR